MQCDYLTELPYTKEAMANALMMCNTQLGKYWLQIIVFTVVAVYYNNHETGFITYMIRTSNLFLETFLHLEECSRKDQYRNFELFINQVNKEPDSI